jgi:hypothetical protein
MVILSVGAPHPRTCFARTMRNLGYHPKDKMAAYGGILIIFPDQTDQGNATRQAMFKAKRSDRNIKVQLLSSSSLDLYP